MKNLATLALAWGLTLASSVLAPPAHAAESTGPGGAGRPNILLIVADDMGYSDTGAFGGEIRTPNIDALAARGLRATSFYVGPTCSPTRSMLMSGVDNHVAGQGNMSEYLGAKQKGRPGYEGHLNDRVVSMASVLRDAGYHTYMAGKWHLGEQPDAWPAAKGFERDFAVLPGGGSNWSDMTYPNPAHPRLLMTRNGRLVEKLPDDHFSSAAFSDFIMQSVDEHQDDGKPFFAYLSFQAVHSPFAAPDDWLDRFSGEYDQGYDALRAQRLARMKDLGLVGRDVQAFPRLPNIPAWDTLTPEQQRSSARRMEIYAAMLANMDHHIGRVLDHLGARGRLDNTLVIFLSDNGAEFTELLALVDTLGPGVRQWTETNFDLRPEHWGRKRSLVDYGPAWAQAGSVPFRLFKHYVAEGGIRSPLIIAGPGVRHRGDVNGSVLHVMDIAPTLYEMTGAKYPATVNGRPAPALQGRSLVPLLAGGAEAVRGDDDWIGWELFGNRAVRQGDWKLLYLTKEAGGTGQWELFNLREDPAELHDLSGRHPGQRKALLARWDRYVKQNGVILTGDGPFAKGGKETPQTVIDD